MLHVNQKYPTWIILFFFLTSDLQSELEWEIAEPFSIEPQVSKLQPGEVKKYKATFRPEVIQYFVLGFDFLFLQNLLFTMLKISKMQHREVDINLI